MTTATDSSTRTRDDRASMWRQGTAARAVSSESSFDGARHGVPHRAESVLPSPRARWSPPAGHAPRGLERLHARRARALPLVHDRRRLRGRAPGATCMPTATGRTLRDAVRVAARLPTGLRVRRHRRASGLRALERRVRLRARHRRRGARLLHPRDRRARLRRRACLRRRRLLRVRRGARRGVQPDRRRLRRGRRRGLPGRERSLCLAPGVRQLRDAVRRARAEHGRDVLSRRRGCRRRAL